jgi:hypothetical protein
MKGFANFERMWKECVISDGLLNPSALHAGLIVGLSK